MIVHGPRRRIECSFIVDVERNNYNYNYNNYTLAPIKFEA